MKLLTKMLLINWHYIKYEVIDFSRINFLTGKNAAGKSTIIDALQLVLLGDTSGYYFNKAANDKSRRTLKGYLWGEVAEDENTNTIYLRDHDFSSYLVLEFLDQKVNKHFCLGVVFDCYADGSHDYQFFRLNDQLPGGHFVRQGTELNRKELKAYFLNNYKKSEYDFFETNESYKGVLLGKLGNINKRFFRLLKKAVPFSPIMDIKGFISEFVCDVENKIDITDMQENIRYYKQLEQELVMVKNKVEALENVKSLFASYKEELKKLRVQEYLIDRGEVEKQQEDIINLEKSITGLKEKLEITEQGLNEKDGELKLLREKRDKLYQEKVNSDIYNKHKELTKKMERLEEEISFINKIEVKLKRLVQSHFIIWREVLQWSEENLDDMPALGSELQLLDDIYKGQYELVSETELLNLKEKLQAYVNELSSKYHNFKDIYENLKKEAANLKVEIERLKLGIKPFPAPLVELKQLIANKLNEKYGVNVEPHIFADLLEIKGDKWRNAVEAYLHTQKFYLIIEPEYFLDALKIYDEFKFTNNLYDVGLVDIEKIMANGIKPVKNSLAEEIETGNHYARVYANYLLGRVMKCEKLKELRNHRTAITPTCMLYHNYVARQLNPDRYKTPYIGRRAIAEQIKLKERRLEELFSGERLLGPKVNKLAQLRSTVLLNDDNIKSLLDYKGEVDKLPGKQAKLAEIKEELGRLDLSYLEGLEKALQEVEKNIDEIEQKIRNLENLKGQYRSQKKAFEDSIPSIYAGITEKQREIANKYEEQWIESTGEPRFLKELQQRKNSESIVQAFKKAIKGTRTLKDNKWRDLLEARSCYIREYDGSFDVQAENNNAFDRELQLLKDTTLVAYDSRIKDAREKAQVQFQEDFISKLRNNIERAREQIDDLNKALKDVCFGSDKYRFKVTPSAQYKKYYDMITDDMLLEGFTLFSGAFQEKFQDVVEELFRQIVATEEGLLSAEQREELNKNLEKFTDYRTYLDFDLVVSDASGRESRLSRVITKKSGGETQTPFYISVLASFVQLYRINQRNQDNTVRIIVFDEAYSKMDHQRIKESISLIRKLGLQVILSAPTEKIGDIAPLVDRNLCVTRIKNETIVKAFDPKELTEMGA